MKKVIKALLLLLLCVPAYGQDPILTDCGPGQKIETIKIYFDHDKHAINLNIKQNQESLLYFSYLFEKLNRDPMTVISKIEINSYTSPEGSRSYNKQLSERRSNSMYDYLSKSLSVPDSLLQKKFSGPDWEGLQELVKKSDMQYKDEVLEILTNVPEETWQKVQPNDQWLSLIDSRNKHLMELRSGDAYRYMFANIYPKLRHSSVVTIYYVINQPPILDEDVVMRVLDKEPLVIEPIAKQPQPQPQPQLQPQQKFALKSNLLQLGIGVVNGGAEIGIGNKFSLDIPFTYSPYTIYHSWRIRTLSTQPEFRYWLKESFTGHFFGAHIHAGYFNISTDNQDRYQNSADRPLLGYGISYGYALNLYKRLNLELNVGVGYANIKYDVYYNINNGALYETYLQRDYWGLTRAGISLVYMFNFNK